MPHQYPTKETDMSHELNTSSYLYPSENQLNHERSDIGFFVRPSHIRDLGFAAACYLAQISNLSTARGYCWITNDSLGELLGEKERTIQVNLKKLEDKKYIWRNVFSRGYGKGTIRHIVTTDNAHRYWKEFLNRECVPADVKEDFYKFFFGDAEIKKQNTKRIKVTPAESTPAKSCGDIDPQNPAGPLTSLTNEYKRNDERLQNPVKTPSLEYAIPGRSSSSLPLGQGERGLGPPDPDAQKVRLEMKKSGIQGQKVEEAVQYYKNNKEKVDSKRNPMGWLITVTKNGAIADENQHHRASRDAKIVPLNGGGDRELNKGVAEEFQEWMQNHPSSYHMTIGRDCIYMENVEEKRTLPLPYHDTRFKKSLELMKEKILGNACHTH